MSASKSTWRASSARNWSSPPSGVGIAYGFMPGTSPSPCSIPAQTMPALAARSSGELAALSSQNSSCRAAARSRSPVRRPAQASSAQIAPPEVPDRPTTSVPASSSAVSRRASTPAVKAVWLPPPWQATAIRRGAVRFMQGRPVVAVGRGR
ncbi:MAG: hypothetical protein L0I76_29285, partial [Pseudonocardia sp.]|nr:hypothetical protein [Pseudonocardia sp.]